MKTDKELLDFLQDLTNESAYTGRVVLRQSSTDRGWRLHECERPTAVRDVRKAIEKFMIEWENGV